jgi:hypothetical protein
MPATRAKVEVQDRLQSLFCMACGAPVYTASGGHADESCNHVRFFIGWDGELSLSDPESSTGADRVQQQAIVDVVESTDSWDEFLGKVAEILPSSVLILEVSEQTREGSDDARAIVGYDLDQSGEEE